MSTTTTAPVLPKRRLANVPSVQLSLADEMATFELNSLPLELVRYLAAVDTFTAELGRRPFYRPETAELGRP